MAGMALALSGAVPAAIPLPPVQSPAGVVQKTAVVDGVDHRLQIGGTGPVVVLLHGYAQTSHMWVAADAEAGGDAHRDCAGSARRRRIRERTAGGYDKKTMAAEMQRAGSATGLSPSPCKSSGMTSA